MTADFPKLMSDVKPQVKEAERMSAPKKVKKKKTTAKLHLNIPYSNCRGTQIKKKILKEAKWEKHFTIKEQRITLDILETMEARRG